MQSLRPDSALVSYGSKATKPTTIPYTELLYNNVTVHGFWFFRWMKENPEEMQAMSDRLLPLLEDEKIKLESSLWAQLEDSFAGALQDTNPNVILQFGTVEEAKSFAKQFDAEWN